MLLKSIRLKNFKCYEECSYNFDLGITSICGENGSGKSSIIEAISWILFNFLPYSSASRIIRNGAKTAEVELRVQSVIDKHEYLIRRKTQGASCSVFSLNNSVLVAEGVNNVQSWVRHQLGLGINENLTSICRNGLATPQGSLTLDFTESTENRRKIFDVLLGLDEYKNAYVKLADVLKLISEETLKIRLNLAKHEDTEEDLLKLKLEIADKENEFNSQQKQLLNLKTSLESLSEQFKEASRRKEKFLKLEAQKNTLQSQLNNLQEALNKVLEAQTEKNNIQTKAELYESQKEKRKLLQAQKYEFDQLKVKVGQLTQLIELETANMQRAQAEHEKIQSFASELSEVEPKIQVYNQLLSSERTLEKQKTQLEVQVGLEVKYKTEEANLLTEAEKIKEQIAQAEASREAAKLLEQFEESLEKLRSEYNEVNLLEKNKQKFLSQLPGSGLLLEVVKTQYELLKEKLIAWEDEKNQLLAQIEFNEDLLPRLSKSGVCPILLEPCLNLKASQAGAEARESVQIRKTQIQEKIMSLQTDITANQTKQDQLFNATHSLQQIQAIDQQLAGRISQDLLEKGKSLKLQTEEARQARTLLQSLPEKQKQQTKIVQKLQEAQNALNQLLVQQTQLLSLTQELASLSAKLAELKPHAERANVLRSELQKSELIQAMVQKHCTRIEASRDELVQLQNTLQSLQTVPIDLKQIETELEDLEPVFVRHSQLLIEVEKITNLQVSETNVRDILNSCLGELEALQAQDLQSDEWFVSCEAKLVELQNQLNRQSGLCHSLELVLAEKQAHQEKLGQKQAELKQSKVRLAELFAQEQKIGKMRIFYKEMGLRLAKKYTKKIGYRASKLFQEIMQDGSYELTWTEDYQIITYKNGRELPFEVLSGGQQTAAAISLRLGLLQELSNVRFAFFDEPTAHLDAERRSQLAMQISAIKSFDQLFVITHDESFAGQANNRIIVGA
jgi:DNA repair protein SbcC/Rad50